MGIHKRHRKNLIKKYKQPKKKPLDLLELTCGFETTHTPHKSIWKNRITDRFKMYLKEKGVYEQFVDEFFRKK